jgi:hypothetical protein
MLPSTTARSAIGGTGALSERAQRRSQNADHGNEKRAERQQDPDVTGSRQFHA